MSVHLTRAMDQIKHEIIELMLIVEKDVRTAVASVTKRDEDLAQEVFRMDTTIDDREVEIEEECLKLLALHHPVAGDLRFIVACLKINNDLERIGDAAVNIAERAVYLARNEPIPIQVDFNRMATLALTMLRNGMTALVDVDVPLARRVIETDDQVDALNRKVYEQVIRSLRESPGATECLIHALGISRHLERIADLATNIAEDVIYTVRGEIIRHRAEDYFAAENDDRSNAADESV